MDSLGSFPDGRVSQTCEYFVAALPVSERGETARTESLFLKKKKKQRL